MPERKKCTGHSSRTGEPCENWPMHGSNVCHAHGGRAKQVKRAAEMRAATIQAHAEAERMVAIAGVDADPVEHLLHSLLLTAALMRVYGTMVAALDAHAPGGELRGRLAYSLPADEESRDALAVSSDDPLLAFNFKGEAQLHPYVVEYHRLIESRAKLAKLCSDVGVAERQVELHERQVDLAARAFEAMLSELGLDGSQRQEAREAYARHLRLVS